MTRRFTRKPSVVYQSAVEAVRALMPFGDSPVRAYAEATAEDVCLKWQKQYSLYGRLRESMGSVCIDRLLGKQCTGYTQSDHTCGPLGADHSSLWNLDGKPAIYVMQPYDLSWDALSGIVDFCRSRTLEAHISAPGSWHFPGCTVS